MLELSAITPLDLIVMALATYRLANMLVTEDGPKAFVARIRQLAGVGRQPESVLAGVLGCVLCCSIWTGTLVFVIWMLVPISHWFIWPLAISGAACLSYLGTRDNINIKYEKVRRIKSP